MSCSISYIVHYLVIWIIIDNDIIRCGTAFINVVIKIVYNLQFSSIITLTNNILHYANI
jgi:hypothetical protein